MAPHYISCLHCGESRDISGRYTSPENQTKDTRDWNREHGSGRCLLPKRLNELNARLVAVDDSPGDFDLLTDLVTKSLDELERLISRIEKAKISRDQFSTALNRAADQIAQLDLSDVQLRSISDLMCNASLHFLDHPDADLEGAIEANYGDDPDEVLSWIR